MIQLSDKQKEFIKEAINKEEPSRFNIKTGATRSGKTYLDILFTIPYRIRERHGKDGLNVILGVTNSTIERNILQPLRELYGDKLVGTINSHNIAKLFGEDVYCLGAEKVSDSEAEVLSMNIAKRIQEEMTYPGQIKITVIRETRAINYAK